MSKKPSTKLSTKTWHYKLMKLVMGSIAPTPQNMHNLCPYAWLLVFSVLVSPVVIPIKFVIWLVTSINTTVSNFVMNQMTLPAASSWADSLSDFDLYQIYNYDASISKSYIKAFGTFDYRYEKNIINIHAFVIEQWEKRYKVNALTDKSDTRGREYTTEFTDWLNEQGKMLVEYDKQQSTAEVEKRKKAIVYEDRMRLVRDSIQSKLTSIKEYFKSWKNIIKWTKRFVGLIITTSLLLVTYFIVNFIGAGVLWVVEHWDWQVVFNLGITIVCIALIILIIYLMRSWINYMKYKGTTLWYVKLLYWIATILIWPVKLIFYRFVWQTILVNGWFFIVSAAKGFWRMLLGFFGIFGEYFGASYTDYCPGIEWEENEED